MKQKEIPMQVVHPNAAGIDIGSRTHWVAVDQNPGNVREFGVYTRDHQRLINYLTSHQITSVAMESTGSYWQTLFHALQKAGFEVIPIQGNFVSNSGSQSLRCALLSLQYGERYQKVCLGETICQLAAPGPE